MFCMNAILPVFLDSFAPMHIPPSMGETIPVLPLQYSPDNSLSVGQKPHDGRISAGDDVKG